MPVRDLRGEEIPVGKIARRLRYDGIVEDESPAWTSLVGTASETKTNVAAGRGELHIDVSEDRGGIALPQFHTDGFRELQLRIGMNPQLTDGSELIVGFADEAGVGGDGNWCYLREPGDAFVGESAHMWFGASGIEETTGNLGIVTHGSELLECRIRPFEQGVTVSVGGAGRGDVFYENRNCPFHFDDVVRPQLLVDADGSGNNRVALSLLEVVMRHN